MELNGKNLGKFFDAKRANRHHETSEESSGKFSLLLINAEQSTTICFVQRHWQVVQHAPYPRRKRATESVGLADHPAEPSRQSEGQLFEAYEEIRYTYMPFDLWDKISTTSRLSSSFHLRMFRSERTTDSMYLIMSSFCLLSS